MPATLVALYLVRNFEAVCNRAIYLANRISQLPNQIRLMKNLFTWGVVPDTTLPTVTTEQRRPFC